jgi:PAS domain S-box-containing protein
MPQQPAQQHVGELHVPLDRAAEELRQSDEQFRLLVKSVQDYAIFMLDLEGHVASWNPGAERIKGYRAEEILGRHFSIFYPSEDVDRGIPDAQLREACLSSRVVDEGWRIRKDGSRFWANGSIAAIRDGGGNVIGFAKITRDLTERRRAEEALHENEARTRLIFDTALDAVITMDEHGLVKEWNPQAERIFGWRYDEAVGRRMSELLIPPRYRAAHENGLRHFLATGAGPLLNRRVEITAVRRDGNEFPVELSIAPHQVGDTWFFSGFVRDITHRKQAEASLRESEERFRLLVESIEEYAIFMLDLDGLVVSWNPGAERIRGYPAEEVLGRHFSIFYPPEDIEQGRPDAHWRAATTAFRVEDEGWRVRKDRSRFWANVVLSAMRNSEGNVIGFANITRDLTERRRAEEALRASEVRWRTMFEKFPVGIVLRDAEQRYMAANPVFQQMIGYSEQELSGLSPLDITHEDDRLATERALAEFRGRVRQSAEKEKRFRHRDGSVVWAMLSTFCIPETGSMPAFYPAIVVDITKRKHAEAALREAEIELARASRLTTKGELAASIAHELRQPLSAAVTNATTCQHWLAEDTLDLARARRAAQRMIEAVRRASEVMDRIRGLIDKTPPEKIRVIVNDLIRETLAVMENELRARQIVVAAELAEPSPTVMGDQVQLQQVVLNLIVNAVEAMSLLTDRPRLLRVRARCEAPAGVLVAVEDSGTGLDPAIAEHIFDPFFTTKAGGMGMGLSICRSIIDSHGGRLWASPAPSHGAVVQFTLPSEDSAP